VHPEHTPVMEAVAALARTFGDAPRSAIVLGSGLGALVDAMEVEASAPMTELGLPGSTVPGHAGRVVVGRLDGHRVVVCAGRVHLYEGHAPAVVVRAVRALAKWGVEELFLTCSVGGIRDGLTPGTVTVVHDHVNMQRSSPLTGPAFGTRFPDMGTAYAPALRARLHQAAERAGLRLPEVVLAAMPGPAYETPAEIRMLRAIGADVVGMSTVPEVLAAAELGLPTAAVAVVSNLAAGLSDGPLNHEEVTVAANQAASAFLQVLRGALRHD
jgi:inosine/guanosine/xanthosine phosphorylase family protein